MARLPQLQRISSTPKLTTSTRRQTSKTAIFNPRKQIWNEHFEFSEDETEIIGKTACGRATVIALRLNFEQAVSARKIWVSVGW